MKKILLCFVILIQLGCDKDDNPAPTIFKKWYYKEFTIDQIVTTYDGHESCGKDYLQFYDTNNVRAVDVSGCEEQIVSEHYFSLNENMLTFYSNGESFEVRIVQLTNNVLKYEYFAENYYDGQEEHYVMEYTAN